MPVSSQARLWASKSQAFAYVLGAGFKFAVSDFCSLQLEVDYLSTTPEFEEVVSYSGALRTSYTYNPFKQRMELLNFNLGLGFNFK